MKILVQNNQPTSGNIISSDNVGYLIEEPKLFLSKTGLENLKYLSNLYGVDYNQEIFRSLIQELDLTQSINKKVKTYSLGTKQKLALLLTLVTEPDILILDEPTNGLDIESSQIVLAVLKNLALHENVGILISSHKLEDIEEICERVLFLENGLLTFQKVGKDSHNFLFEIAFSSATDRDIFITKQEFGDIVQEEGLRITMSGNIQSSEFFKFFNENSIKVVDFETKIYVLSNFLYAISVSIIYALNGIVLLVIVSKLGIPGDLGLDFIVAIVVNTILLVLFYFLLSYIFYLYKLKSGLGFGILVALLLFIPNILNTMMMNTSNDLFIKAIELLPFYSLPVFVASNTMSISQYLVVITTIILLYFFTLKKSKKYSF